MVAPAATSPLSFTPGDTLAEEILIDLSSPDASLSSVAAKHNVSTATLSLWLTKPETQALLHAIESGGYAHTRLAASLNLSSAVPVLLQILADFRTLAATTTDLTDPAYLRASIHARKAAWMLLRLARAHPLTPEQLSAARTTLDATRNTTRHASATPTPAPVPEAPAPTAQARVASVAPNPVSPLAASISTTPTEPMDAQPAPVATVATEPAHIEPAPTSPAPSASITPNTEPARHNPAPNIPHTTPHDHLDLTDLVAHLSSLAESLGIDISDLDDIADNMLQNATGPPDPGVTHPRKIA